jgi:hypothetical protein
MEANDLTYVCYILFLQRKNVYILFVILDSAKSLNGPWLLFVSESGYGKRVPLSRFHSSRLNRVGLIGYKV